MINEFINHAEAQLNAKGTPVHLLSVPEASLYIPCPWGPPALEGMLVQAEELQRGTQSKNRAEMGCGGRRRSPPVTR